MYEEQLGVHQPVALHPELFGGHRADSKHARLAQPFTLEELGGGGA
jgi:hypothetical protein